MDISRFVALIPTTNVTQGDYELILEGYSTPINIEASDARALEDLLQLNQNQQKQVNTPKWEQEQLKRNQRPLELLAKRIKLHQNMLEAEAQERQEVFEDFKHIIDSERLPGQKLYSEK
ncbi:MAG: hypothetical protein HC908_03720 [Calothrix sp. SM1_7_51]|nr:hypothetical protein [Calothrix sp. SM1_7_51]